VHPLCSDFFDCKYKIQIKSIQIHSPDRLDH
jgi:hypothetical protein